MADRPTLVVHPGALGDVLLTVPALRALRRWRPGAPLALAAQPHLAALVEALGEADRALAFESLRLDRLFVDDEASLPADAVREAGRVVCWLGARDEVFARRLREVAADAVVAPSVSGAGPVWQHLLGTVAPQAEPGALCKPVALPPALADEGRRALEAAGWDGRAPVLLVHAGSGGVAKRWPPEGFARAVDAVAARHPEAAIVLHEGPADAKAVDALAARLARPALRLQLPALPALAGALARAALYLGNDSGVSHLAAAVGAPAVVLFAPVNLAWRPWSPAPCVLAVRMDRLDEGDLARVTRAANDAWPS